MATKREQFNLKLPAADHQRLRDLALEACCSESAVMRLLIRSAVVQPARASATVPMGGEKRAI